MKRFGFLRSIHYFRGFAILNVVAVHSWKIPPGVGTATEQSLVATAREVAFHDSTMYFLFIAGFLFMHLADNFEWRSFFRKKLAFVVLPYVLVSSACFAVKCTSTGPGDWLRQWVWTLLTGSVQAQLWYVPFVCVIYLLSPPLLSLSRRQWAWLGGTACLLPLLGTRTGTHIWPLQFVYFAPMYVLGCWARVEYEAFTRLARRYSGLLVVGAVLATLALVLLSPEALRFGWVDGGESLSYVQKLSITLVVLNALQAWENRPIAWLNLLANHSFPIFFLHTIVGNSAARLVFFSLCPAGLVVPWSILFVIVAVAVSLAISLSLRVLLGKRSRLLIGA